LTSYSLASITAYAKSSPDWSFAHHLFQRQWEDSPTTVKQGGTEYQDTIQPWDFMEQHLDLTSVGHCHEISQEPQ
jgi:hypothetical protein